MRCDPGINTQRSKNAVAENAAFHESLGLQHLAIAFSETSRLHEVDLSSNDIGPENFTLLQSVFVSNNKIELLNLDNTGIDGAQVA